MLTQEVELVVLYDTEEGLRLPAKKWWCSIACPARAAGRRCSPRSFSGNPPLRRREREWRFPSPWPSADGSGEGGGPGDWPGDLGGKAGARRPAALCDSPGSPPWGGLWTVAKAYLTTDSDIMEASGLTSGEIFPGQMLLIPRKSS